MSLAWATITRCVMWPLMSSPRMSWARALASSELSASFTPPALPRPPVFTCALTTTGTAISRAIAAACSGVSATPPGSTGMPCEANRSRAWYSKRSTNRHRSPPVTGLPHRPLPRAARRGRHHRVPHPYAAARGLPCRLGLRGLPSGGGGADVPAYPVDDLGGGRPRREDARDAEALELGDVLLGDDPAAEDDDVVDPALLHEFGQPREQRHVRPREDRQPHGVGVLLHDGLDDLLRGLVQACVDDLHAGIA